MKHENWQEVGEIINLHNLPQIDSVILCKLAKNKGGGQSHMKKGQSD